MGEAFGEALRADVHELYRRRLANALEQAAAYGGRRATEEHLLAVAHASWPVTRRYDPAGAEELEGIARGAGLSIERILAMNGLTDYRDVLAWGGELEAFGGCSSVIVQRDATRHGRLLCAQTWDLATDNMPFLLGLHRKPREGPETWCMTTAGCLSLIGMNDQGIAIGTTNLRTTDARAGVMYLSIIHKALAARTQGEAIRAVVEAERSGAHYYYVCDRSGAAVGIECTAKHAHRRDVLEGIAVHCNHCLTEECARIEGAQPSESSHARQVRLETWLGERRGEIDEDTLRQALADRSGGALAVCRHDPLGISTNGAVVMSPEEGLIEACLGLPQEVSGAAAGWVNVRRAGSSPLSPAG